MEIVAARNGMNLNCDPKQGRESKVPLWLENALKYLLGLDGFFHLAEMGMAIYENAFITATMLGVSAVIMFVACWVLGERHSHH